MLSKKQLGKVLHGLLLSYVLIHPAAAAHRHFLMFLHELDNHPGNAYETWMQRYLLPGRVIITSLGLCGVPHAIEEFPLLLSLSPSPRQQVFSPPSLKLSISGVSKLDIRWLALSQSL